MGLGKVVFISSGETSVTGGLIFRRLAGGFPKGFRIAVLETPAGFEPNSAQVARRVADSILLRLGEWEPRISVIPARRRGGSFGTDSPQILAPLPAADWIFMGAGSPTYAVRQMRGSLAWQELLAAWQQGAALIFASAAAVAAGIFTLPVYEIFKAGEDPVWKPGLDLFGALGWKMVVVSHWNNTEGGEEVDTSRCFIGRERFELLSGMLPDGIAVLGLDEHTAVILDWDSAKARVEGKGTAVLCKQGREHVFPAGSEFALGELGDYRVPAEPFGMEPGIWEDVQTRRRARDSEPIPPPEVIQWIDERERLRRAGQYAKADDLRQSIERLGWKVMDTPQGPVARPAGEG